jgi:copper homeostasis protein
MNLEICVDSVESAIAAARGGAKRIELCSALSEGGVTPSAGLISAVRAAANIELFVIIRPRGGDFVYSECELKVMRADIYEAKSHKIDGVVLGVLTPEQCVDVAQMRLLIDEARPLKVTFHRAFDVCKDLDQALEDVIATGADRILTSGGKPDAIRGAGTIAHLRQKAGDRIRIMAGGGIRVSNLRTIALKTGVQEVHTSLSEEVDASTSSERAELSVGRDGYKSFRVLERDVREFKSALGAIAAEAKQREPLK